MSKIEVDTIAPQSGTTVTLGESGDTITVPSGATLDTSNSTVTLPDDSVTTAKINNEAVTPAKLGYNYNQFRNIIINGDMSIAQRGTSATGIGNGDTGYHTLDRWKFFENDSPSYEFTMSQSTDVPSGQGFATSLKMDCTTAEASLAADDLAFLEQYIEGQNVQYLKKGTSNAEYVTASFWVKSTKTGTFIVELVDLDNSRFTNFNYTVNASDTWEKKTVSFVPDTTGTLDNDNAASLLFRFGLLAGTTFSSGTPSPTTWLANSGNNAKRAANQVNIADNTANNFLITGVQLEAGTTESDFEFLPYDINLMKCERYFKFSMLIGGYGGAPIARASQVVGASEFNVPIQGQVMRAAPTATVESPGTPDLRGITTLGSGTGSAFDGGNLTLNTIVTSKMTGKVVRVRGGAAGAYADGTGLAIFNNGSEFNAKLDAEL